MEYIRLHQEEAGIRVSDVTGDQTFAIQIWPWSLAKKGSAALSRLAVEPSKRGPATLPRLAVEDSKKGLRGTVPPCLGG